jgi:nitrite reductase (NADH) small subunit
VKVKGEAMPESHWYTVCKLADLVENSGVCALVNGQQVALFYLPAENPPLYAIDNRDPLGGANVLSRGIVGDLQGELVVASPLYKQHFSLVSGRCLEQQIAVRAWPARIEGDSVQLQQPPAIEQTQAA